MEHLQKTNNLTNIQTKLAIQKFEEYKTYIVKEIVNNYQGSFMTIEKLGTDWQKTFVCNTEYVNALKKSTKEFFYTFPAYDLNYCSPVFFEKLIREICIYIAPYICRLDKKENNESECKEILFKELFSLNNFVQGQNERYRKKFSYQLKKLAEEKAQTELSKEKRIRKRIGEIKPDSEKIVIAQYEPGIEKKMHMRALKDKTTELIKAKKRRLSHSR